MSISLDLKYYQIRIDITFWFRKKKVTGGRIH